MLGAILRLLQILPAAAILVSYLGFVLQVSDQSPVGQVTVAISGGTLILCFTLIWKASSFQTKVLTKMEEMVTIDRMERRLVEERLANERRFVVQSDCDNHMARGANA